MAAIDALAVTKFLPDIELPAGPAGMLIGLRPSMGRTTVLVSVHSSGCDGCRRYLDELGPSSPEFRDWDARLLIVVPGGENAAEQLRPPFGTVLADKDRHVSSPDDAAVIVADRYGHIYDLCRAGAGHRLPPPRQLEEWLKFLGTQCPE
jgi:hypothetical protein